MKLSTTLIAIWIASSASAAIAEVPPQTTPATATATATQPADVRLTLTPTALPEPALKYQFTIGVADQTPGDAAELYLQGFMLLKISQDSFKIQELLDAPREKFSIPDAESILGRYRPSLSLVEFATRRDRCHWGAALRELSLEARLSYLSPGHSAGLLLSLQARVQIAQGHFDDAIHTLQTGFTLAENLNHDACLVQGLVAIGVAHLMLDRVEEFIQTPGAPNLYWALANLPRPLGDMRAMTRIDRSWLELEAPEFRRGGTGRIGTDRLVAMIVKIRQEAAGAPLNATQKQEIRAFVMSAQKPARAWLASHGYTADQLKELPDDHAVSIYLIRTYRLASDELFARAALPYWQAADGYRRAAESLPGAREVNPLLEIQPSMSHVHRHITLTERRLAMLQIAEALRGYAGAHGSRLPASLDDLVETPIPQDPATGKTFIYRTTGNTSLLRSLAPAEREGELSGVYRIAIRR